MEFVALCRHKHVGGIDICHVCHLLCYWIEQNIYFAT